jgi:ribose transport system permease protein
VRVRAISTGKIEDDRPAWAAVVIGGVSLAGGRGGIFGPVVAAFVLTLIPADLIFMNIDPNFGQVIQGTIIVLVVMMGGFFTLARSRK